jgi:hypothetical protein
VNPPAESPALLNRREALARMAWLAGGAFVGAEFFLNGVKVSGKQTEPGFSAAELALMDEVGETIIPATDTPGAKAAGIGAFMAMMVNDCYDDAHHAIFQSGLGRIDAAARAQHGKSFVACTPAERTGLLNALDAEARAQRAHQPRHSPPHYFSLLKQLTTLGYFTSEVGCTQALRYIEVPGAFHGDVPYRKGDRAWFGRPNTSLL